MNKHCIITGASSGLGKETARLLANDGWSLTLICRNEDKTKNAIAYIKKGNKALVDFCIADLTLMQDVRKASEALLNKGKAVDVLIHNAGCLTQGRKVSKEGWEFSNAINYLAPFLLTNSIKPLLHSDSRIININSAGHANQVLDMKSLNAYSGYKAYAHSKLTNALFTIELVKRNRVAVCADPGTMGTGFGGNLSLPMRLLMSIIKPFLPNSKSSARQSHYLATCPKDHLSIGGYYVDSKEIGYQISKASINLSSELWDETELLLGV
ncbi:SDR family NAD(P)-dependent oxidoreductase [Maribacter sp.]|nr:SDR family NAD(P)-dependent oxidoreductase [Maribacter sp.]